MRLMMVSRQNCLPLLCKKLIFLCNVVYALMLRLAFLEKLDLCKVQLIDGLFDLFLRVMSFANKIVTLWNHSSISWQDFIHINWFLAFLDCVLYLSLPDQILFAISYLFKVHLKHFDEVNQLALVISELCDLLGLFSSWKVQGTLFCLCLFQLPLGIFHQCVELFKLSEGRRKLGELVIVFVISDECHFALAIHIDALGGWCGILLPCFHWLLVLSEYNLEMIFGEDSHP